MFHCMLAYKPVNARLSSDTHTSVAYLVIGSFPFCKGNSPISGDLRRDYLTQTTRSAVVIPHTANTYTQ